MSEHEPLDRDLKQWLANCNCQLYYARFVENGVTLSLVLELDTAALKELGVTKLGDRLRLELAIGKLKAEAASSSVITNEELQRLIRLHLNGDHGYGDGLDHGHPSSAVDNGFGGPLTVGDSGGSTPSGATVGGGSSSAGTSGPSSASTIHYQGGGISTHNNDSSTLIVGGNPFYGHQNSSNGSAAAGIAGNNSASTTTNSAPSSGGVPTDSNKNVTFIFQDGLSKKVNITGCFNAQSIKRKVLKKLGIKQTQDTYYDAYVHSFNTNNYDSNHIVATPVDPTISKLFDVELVTICYSPDRLEKYRIMLCPNGTTPTEMALETSKKIIQRYEKFAAKNSSSGNGSLGPSTRLRNPDALLSQFHMPDQRTGRTPPPPLTLRNFFGQRPPSELISSNLAEYFPEAKQKELEATVRNSVRYSVRLSRRFNVPSNLSSSSNSSIHRRSILSINNKAPSLASLEHNSAAVKRFPTGRTIGEMMVNNITAIDTAVNNDISSFLSGGHTPATTASATMGPIGKPPSIYSNMSGGANNDTRSIISGMSKFGSPSQRLSIPANFADLSSSGNNRYSRIELLSVDSEEDDENDEIFNSYWEMDGAVVGGQMSGLGGDYTSHLGLGLIIEGGPKNWLQGARIGAGSFGTVYLGMNPLTGELMAVKQVSLPDERSANNQLQKSMIEALQHEMLLLKELNHENIVRYLGSSTEEKFLNIFLEYVPGGSVLSMLSSYGPFEEPLIRNFIRQVLIGLSYLHGEDIIHRDIKGANILIDIKGTVKISDFGISKKVSGGDDGIEGPEKSGRRASLQGSVYWMAPEVVKQTAYTKKADIWSVGCLIVEMFTGKHPFPDFSQMQAIFKIGTHITPQIPEWCTREAKDFLIKTFELDYEKRPDAVDMLGEAFLNTLILSKK